MNRPFLLGLVSAGVGLGAGFAYRMVIQATGRCEAILGVADRSVPCSPTQSWVAFLNVFAVVTLVGCLASSIVLARRLQETPAGYVGLGDTLLAVGTIVAVVEVAVFAVIGGYLGIAYGALAAGLTLFALKQERQVSLAVSAVMAIIVFAWVMSDPQGLALGLSPALLWGFAAGAYVASLKTGEHLVDVVSDDLHRAAV